MGSHSVNYRSPSIWGGEKLRQVSIIGCMTPPNSVLVHDQAARDLRKGGSWYHACGGSSRSRVFADRAPADFTKQPRKARDKIGTDWGKKEIHLN